MSHACTFAPGHRAGHRRFARHRPRDCAGACATRRNVIGTATSDAARRASAQWLSEAGFKGRGAVLNVADPASVDALLKDLEEQGRRADDPGQQCRNYTRQPAAANEARGVGRHHEHQPRLGVPAVEGRAARHDEGAPRPHHQHRLGRRRHGQRRPGELCRGEGRHHRLLEVAGARGRLARDHGERRRARVSSRPT